MFQFNPVYQGTQPRAPMQAEMFEALSNALDVTMVEQERRYWLGVAVGYSIGFGIGNPDDLHEAEATHYALPVSYPEAVTRAVAIWPRNLGNQDAVIFASGVLMGYTQSTSERADADQCVVCSKRICTDVDDHQSCPDGVFCAEGDCYGQFGHGRDCRAEQWSAA